MYEYRYLDSFILIWLKLVMSKFTKLLELTDYADAKPILESAKNLSDASYTLAQTAYQIKETQPQVARNFLKTVIKECEDEEEKIKESDGGKSEGSSSTTGLEKVGTEGNADESMTQATNTHDQMGVAIGEMAPPMGGMPPQQPPQIPQQQAAPPQGMPPQAPPPPQVQPQQMQYTVQEALSIRSQFKQFKEALTALTKEIKETQNSQIKSMDVGTAYKGESMVGKSIKETIGDPARDLDKTRSDIKKMNDAINKGA